MLEFHHFGKGEFAYLTLEFGEVVGRRDPFDLLLNFAVDPRLQTTHVNQLTTAFTIARRNQRVVNRLLAAQAHLAV
jgi:hypothetical protein